MDIELKNYSKKYGEAVIFENLNLTFKQGEIACILGASGRGKTTILNSIAGLIPYDGEILGLHDETSYIFQNTRLIDNLSIYKNIDLILSDKIKDKTTRKNLIETKLNALELGDLLNKRPKEISGGQAQRVAMARAFLYPSNVLLMDEPFKALDIGLKGRLVKNFVELWKTDKRTVVFVTHAIDEALLLADTIFVLANGDDVAPINIDIPQENRNITDSNLDDIRKTLLSLLTNN